MRPIATLALLPLVVGGCAASLLSARKPPAQLLPVISIEPGPIPQGHGRVAIDVVDGPTMVSRAGGESRALSRVLGAPGGYNVSFGSTSFLCQTPCVVDLPFGSHRLLFRKSLDSDEGSVVVGPRPSVYRRALGYHRAPSPGTAIGGLTSITLGTSGLLTGPMLMGVERSGLSTSSIAITAAGGALAIAGAVLLSQVRDEVKPGTAIQWAPADGVVYTLAP